jgi:ABC-2 type transport system ATP-binding protein
MNTPAIQIDGLTKDYAVGFWRKTMRRSLDHLTLQVNEGEAFGFLGPNGAGKTTTLKMLAGLIYPTSGTASVLGYVPWQRHDGYRRQFALLLGQKNQLWWDLPARESLELNRAIYGIQENRFREIVGQLTELLDVTDKLGVMVRELSLGERMKMELIAALLHRPKVLFLDEPTIGLDVISQRKVREFLRAYNAERRVVTVLTSHYMQDIEELCQRVIVIDGGKIIYDGALDGITARFAAGKVLTLEFTGRDGSRDFNGLGEVLARTETSVQLRVPGDQVAAVCRRLFDAYPVKDISVAETPIEDVIAQLFAKNAAAAPAVSAD